jgi:predicted Zn finger-like uncharacterized protein
MFTTCPSCALNLAVTAADLRVGQGYVRCGRCVSVFNALISLADEAEVGPDETLHVEDKAEATQSRPVLDLPMSGPLVDAAPEGLAEVTDESRDMGTGTFETIVLEGDTILQTEEFVDEAEVDEQIAALAVRIEEQHQADGIDADAQLEAALPRPLPAFVRESQPGYGDTTTDAAGGGGVTHDAVDSSLDSLLAPRRAKRPLPRLMIFSIVLAALLVLQVVHHWRYPLAEHLPWVGNVYAGIGAPLAPQWQLAAYDVRQLGATTDPANAQRIEVRASVRNGAERAQPAPVLRVILQDRFGNELGRHERAPADYTRGTALDMLAADQRVDASFWIDDPEQKAVGFELDACLRGAEGVLRCASDPAPR